MRIILLTVFFLLCACGVNRYAASTTASYKTPDGTVVEYESNKEHEGVVVEIKDVDGKAKSITIKVEQAGTSEAAVAAALQTNLKLTEMLQKLMPMLEKAAMAGS